MKKLEAYLRAIDAIHEMSLTRIDWHLVQGKRAVIPS